MTVSKKPSAKEMAQAIIDKSKQYGFSVSTRGTVLSIEKRIPAGDSNAFASAETDASIILSMAPQTSAGSVWGTDGGSVGGAVAIQNGRFAMNKSGVSVRVINAINKLAA